MNVSTLIPFIQYLDMHAFQYQNHCNGVLVSPASCHWHFFVELFRAQESDAILLSLLVLFRESILTSAPVFRDPAACPSFLFLPPLPLPSFRSAGASQVIIDIRSNGGGTVSMGNFFVEMLMGTKALGGQTQLLVGNLRSDTEFVQLLVKKKYGWYDSEGYLNLDEKPFTGKEGDTFFYPLQNKTYGKHGVPGVYSSYFKDRDYANDRKNALTVLYGKGVKEITPILGEKPFILLSDGLCFSTCMNFAYTMRTAFNATIVLVGGYPGNPFQVAGGGVAFISPSVTRAFYNTWASDKEVAANPEAPKAFVGPIDMSMQTANGFVPVNATAPIEFNFLKANGWIMYNITRLMDDSIIWAQTAGGFKVVKK